METSIAKLVSEEKNFPEKSAFEAKDNNAQFTDGESHRGDHEISFTSQEAEINKMGSDYPLNDPVQSQSSCTSLFAEYEDSIDDYDPDRHDPPPLESQPRKSCLKQKPLKEKCYVSFHLEHEVKFFFVENLASMRPVEQKTILNDPTRYENWHCSPAFPPSPVSLPTQMATSPDPNHQRLRGPHIPQEESESFQKLCDKPDIKPLHTVAVIYKIDRDQPQVQRHKNPRPKKRGCLRKFSSSCIRVKSSLTRCFSCPSEDICLYLH